MNRWTPRVVLSTLPLGAWGLSPQATSTPISTDTVSAGQSSRFMAAIVIT